MQYRFSIFFLTMLLFVFGTSFPANGQTHSDTRTYRGERISISAVDLSLDDFFRLIAEVSRLNVVIHPAVHGKVTLQLQNVPWDQVLSIVTQQNMLVTLKEGRILYIIPANRVEEFLSRAS